MSQYYDEPNDPCDYCGSVLSDTGRCGSCAAEYDRGVADAGAYRTALLVGGEELAARMEFEAEFGYLG